MPSPRLSIATSLVLAGFVLSGASDAGAGQRVIKAAALSDWPPEYSLAADGTPVGFSIEVMNEVARHADLAVRYERFDSFSEATAALERGEIDVIPNYGISPEREKEFEFTQPIETFDISVFVRAGAPVPQTLEALDGKEVAVVKSNLAANLLGHRDAIRVREYHDVRTALYDLLAGHVDALAFPRPVLERVAEDARLGKRIRVTPIELLEVKRAMAVRRGRTELLAELDSGVSDFVHSTDYRRVYRRWFAAPVEFWTAGRVLYGSAMLFLAMLLGFVWFRSRARGALSREAQGRRRAEQERRITEHKYQTLLDHASDGVYVMDRELRIVEVNRKACELLDHERRELVGQPFSSLVTEKSLADRPLPVERLQSGETVLTEAELARKDGGSVDVEVSARRVSDENIVAIVRDISQRLRAEKARQEQESTQRQAQKLEAVGRLAGGVAHDFNNLLTAIAGYADILSDKLADNPRAIRDLGEIKTAAKRGGALTRQLLAFSRRQTLTPEVLDLGAVAVGLRAMLVRLLGEDVELGVRTESKLRVKADRGQIEQVLMNLVVNARDALPDGGHIGIHIHDVTVDATRSTRLGELVPGRYAVVDVTDDGVGIEDGVLTRIFEPFFTTKEKHRGTGLGLATVLGIVQQSGGQVDVTSSPGKGTTFSVFLPATDQELAAEPEASTHDRARPLANATVMVVEDEAAVRRIIVHALESQAASVREAADPAAALELAEKLDALDVLVTDVVMPGMKGTELAEALVRAYPKLRVLFVSGYTDRALEGRLGGDGRRAFLQKPFTLDALTAAVAELLQLESDSD